jgi:hypothetical protein
VTTKPVVTELALTSDSDAARALKLCDQRELKTLDWMMASVIDFTADEF